MTRVLHVFGAMDVGGAEMRTVELLSALAGGDVRFDFLTLTGRTGALAAEIEALGGTIHPIALGWRFSGRYWRLLRRLRPDVIDSHVATFSGLLLLGAALAGVPRRVAHFRSDGDGQRDTLARRAQRAVMKALIRCCATDIVGVSPSALSSGYRTDWTADRRARVIVNGVPAFTPDPAAARLRVLMGVPSGAVVLIHVGRPSPEKDRPRTVRVLDATRRHGVDAHLALVGGEGADTPTIWSAAAETRAECRVHDLGARRDARELMGQADVLLLTSVREGLPGVVLEALSTGTPVVSTDVPGAAFIASQLPGVTILGRDQSMQDWGAAVAAAVATSRAPGARAAAQQAFLRSAFSADESVRQHREIYTVDSADDQETAGRRV